jgi:hypothetical protein
MTLESNPTWVLWVLLSLAAVGMIVVAAWAGSVAEAVVEWLASLRPAARAFPARDRVNG